MSFLWHGLTDQGAQVPVQVDAQGRVIAVDGTPGVSNWDRTGTTLSPAVPGDSVDIGSGNISLNANGSATFAAGKLDIEAVSGSQYHSQIINTKGDLVVGSRNTSGTTKIVSNRDTYFYGGSSEDPHAALDPSGNFYIGGTLPSAPNISLNSSGSADFAAKVTVGGSNDAQIYPNGVIWCGGNAPAGQEGVNIEKIGQVAATGASTRHLWTGRITGSATVTSTITADGDASFAGNITALNVTFRSADPQFYVKKSKTKDALPEYVGPELDLLAEIARLEALVRHLYETLRLTPPAGWPVWDGNDDVLRQLRK